LEEKCKKKSWKENKFLFGFIIGLIFFVIINICANFVIALYNNFNIIIGHERNLTPNVKVRQIFSILDKYYVDKYNKQAAQDDMYYGMLNSLGDPYTSYMDKKIFSSFMEMTEGSYVGIGTVISIDKTDDSLIIIAPYENSPATKAGLMSGDKVIAVDGQLASKNNYEEIVNKLKGAEGTVVKLKILRPSESKTFDINITREKINIPTVLYKIFNNSIGYLRISNFDKNTYEQFMRAYNLISKQNNLTGLIIDLRNNPGGLLDSVVKITDELIPKGCIVYTEDKHGNRKFINSDDKYIKTPLVILVNENSASASEVLSGAVKDLHRGILVGTKTFGKGLVQNLFPLSDGSAIKVTIAKYYTPSGVCINGKGIEPDHKVEMDQELSLQIFNLSPEKDLQLQKAIEILE